MTPSEAISVLKSECYMFNPLNLDRTRMINEALDLAIKALGSWDKYSTELWQAAYERGKKEGKNEN